MKSIWCVAHNTFIEAIRDRVLYSLILFAILMIFSSLIISTVSAEQYNKIVKDVGLTVISIIGVIISVFLGMGLVHKEIEKKTVYNIFSKPIRRYEFIIGKFLGLAFTIFLITAAMAFILFLIVIYTEFGHAGLIRYYYGGVYFAQFINAVYFEYLEFLIIIGMALLFSSFTTPVLTLLFTFFLFVVGRFSADLRLFAEQVSNPLVSFAAKVIYRVIPNLEKFDVRSEAVYGGAVGWSLISNTTIYAAMYSFILLLLSLIIFQKREFK